MKVENFMTVLEKFPALARTTDAKYELMLAKHFSKDHASQ